MSRFIRALCAFLFATTPVVAIASNSTERPESFRYAVNPLIGDASFIERYGTPPPPGTDPELRVRTHLSFVHSLLSRRDTSDMPPEFREARRENLARFREYIDAGVFPRNHDYEDQNRPCFIDAEGRICAVGYLVEQSAGHEAAERINAKFQYAFVSEMESPEIDRWIASSGLSRLELSLIQPCYNPEFNVTISQTSDNTITIRGTVLEFCCGMSSVAIDFGESVWSSPETKSWYVPIDISHTYSSPGAYVVKVVAISTAWCGFEVEEKTWMVNVGAAVINVSAIREPGGPPYGVYLTTTEQIPIECLTSTLVQWQVGEQPQPTSWYLENGVYRTLGHRYQTQGMKKIQVANTYLANCTTNQSGSVAVNITGIATATEVSTWGRIKAMYR